MADDRYRFSFEHVAAAYERARPAYVGAAVDWALEWLGVGAGSRVLDLAAGTGKLTRQLLERGLDVIAVEPGDEMRSVLEASLPHIDARAGRAEEIPLPDGSADAVTVGQAFHWFETERALAEMHRVVRPGGGFALLWNQFNQDDPLLGAVDELVRSRDPARRSHWRDEYDGSRHFGPLEEKAFYEELSLSADELAAWVASTSRVISASVEEQAEIDREVRWLAAARPGPVALRTYVVVARALS